VIDNFVNKFNEICQKRANLPFCAFDSLHWSWTVKLPARVMPCGKLARFPFTDVI
jgi:hypothetical protein